MQGSNYGLEAKDFNRTVSMTHTYFHSPKTKWKITEQAKLLICSILHLLIIAYTQQIEILLSAL